MLAERETATTTTTTAAFRLGPAVLRAPPSTVRRPTATVSAGGDDDDAPETADLLGELLDMVLVGADDADSGLPEVHLQFKADVFGGLHMRLVKRPEGLAATFIVKDAAARRAVADHVDALVVHLRERGFTLISHELRVQ
ncbi:MAG: hypothetical protein Q8O67_19910 [Deltaproteobacteria bacterium]|nr:hypothetical protein [Deltaproteobacteria bacterium]